MISQHTHTSVRECTCSRFCYANCKKFITVTSQAKIITLKKNQGSSLWLSEVKHVCVMCLLWFTAYMPQMFHMLIDSPSLCRRCWFRTGLWGAKAHSSLWLANLDLSFISVCMLLYCSKFPVCSLSKNGNKCSVVKREDGILGSMLCGTFYLSYLYRMLTCYISNGLFFSCI